MPDFGAFIAEYKPASITHDERKTPSKSLLFNTQLTRNDGLLINALVENESLNYQEAKQEIQSYVRSLNATLEQGKSYTIDGIGRFQLDKAGFIQFHESENKTCYLDSYGLPAVELEKIKRHKKDTSSHNRSKILDYSLKTAAAVILILVVFYASKPNIDTTHTDQAGLGLISDTPRNATAPNIENEAKPQSTEEKESMPIAQIEENTTMPPQSENTPKTPSSPCYHIIIGSLSTESAAQLHLSLYQKNYPFKDISIIEGNNRFRISAAHFSQSYEASTYIKTLKNLNPKAFKDAWTLEQLPH